MAGTDLTVYIGADATAFVKGMDDAINKAAGSKGEGKFANLLRAGVEGGLTGLVSGIGQMFGPQGQLIAAAVNLVIEGVGKLIERAKEFRNLSYATGISGKELSKLEGYAKSTGISLSTLAGAFYEFNKRMATAQIRGSEFNVAAAKLGLDLDKLKDRTMTAQDAMYALSRAHKAGTDAATLAYYGNLLLGSSYEQLLPAIKRGTSDMKAFADVTIKNEDFATESMSRISDQFSVLWGWIEGFFYNFVGGIINAFLTIQDAIAVLQVRIMALFDNKLAAEGLNIRMLGATDERKKAAAEAVAATMDEEDAKEFMEEFAKILGEGGQKIKPFGLQSAQGASQLQQMAGGDIVSAIAFTPLERIATATEQTAQNTKPKNTNNPDIAKGMSMIPLGY
jgi:hypothetical protein